MIYRVPRKREWVISSGGTWIPGAYATRAAARWAFQFEDDVLRRLQDAVAPRAITSDDLRRVRKIMRPEAPHAPS